MAPPSVRRRTLLATLPLAAPPASAQPAWPARPVRIVLPFAAGGGTDVMTRVIADALSNRLGQRFLVENITGAGGTIGTERVIRSDPDGYTFLLATMNVVSINPALYRDLPFDIRQGLVPVSLLLETGHVIVCNPRLPFRDLAELRQAALDRPRTISFASAGIGTSTHLYGELFRVVTGADLVHVPYRGNGPALADVIAGHVDVMFDQVPNSADHIRAGRVRALAVTTEERLSFAPDVRTAAELGMAGMMGTSWAGMSAPRGTPAPVVAALNAALNAVLADAEVRDRLARLGATAKGSTADDFGRLVDAELTKWGNVVRAANLSAER